MISISYMGKWRVCKVPQGFDGSAGRKRPWLGSAACRAVAGYLNGGEWTLVQGIVEIESGKRNDRPSLAAALRLCRKHCATLVIAKLDLMESGVEFVAVDMPFANRFVVNIMAAVAEQEAEAISKRTKAALAAAKARGTVLGGRRASTDRFAEIAAGARQANTANVRRRCKS